MSRIAARLKEQSSLSGVVLLVIVVLVADAAGVDLERVTSSLTSLVAAIGAAAAALKIVLPETPPKDPPA